MKNKNDYARKTRKGAVQNRCTWKSFHAARMERAISAITIASKIAIEIEKMNKNLPKHKELSRGNQFVRKFESESISLSIPDSATLLVDRHLVIPENIESARLNIQNRINQMYDRGIIIQAEGRERAYQLTRVKFRILCLILHRRTIIKLGC